MAKSLAPNDRCVEEEYFDMDFSCAASLCSSPPHSTEFEFQMSGEPPESQTMASPADDLFYKGRLLPLHLPPRLQMVEQLLHASDHIEKSAVVTCESGELHECSDELIRSHPKKAWTRKLKLMKGATLGLSLKASKGYLKSLFSKPDCPSEKAAKKNPFGRVRIGSSVKNKEEKMTEEENSDERRSFSGANHWQSATKSSVSTSYASSKSSSFSSVNSTEFHGQQMLRRSSSANSDVESSIQGAIAYCKKSQQEDSARKTANNVGFCLLPASRIAPDCEPEKTAFLVE
ncbi:probable membrane-associated kinase regulator 4 [Musa acuminata AAA Group]|uniref:probable membrane-associated kinase regulator 4 n=1 Tax=Musa acuminata AAA Group TaxID=214697 RepID=UPI0031CEEF14